MESTISWFTCLVLLNPDLVLNPQPERGTGTVSGLFLFQSIFSLDDSLCSSFGVSLSFFSSKREETMFRIAQKLLSSSTTAVRSTQSPSLTRSFSANGPDVDPVSLQMINYALSLSNSNKSTESYAQSLLILEQCLSTANVREGVDDNFVDNTRGTVLLAMSTLLSESGDVGEAMEKLERIRDLKSSSLGVRVAAMEALVGLNLERGQDVDLSSMLADECLELDKTDTEDGVLRVRAKGIKGLVELVRGNIEMAEKCFEETQSDEGCSGNVALSHGELLHASGKFSLAKSFYEKAIQGVPSTKEFAGLSGLAACNMVLAEVLLAATCALGQLEAHSGNFHEAEEMLTKALTKAEEHFGSHHPKVGVILTCIAFMYRDKARLERSSSILIQEGLYRRAIDLLKAPALETEGVDAKGERRDVVALARGGYAEILCLQQNRKGEGERMKSWAQSTWRNRRLSLAEALKFSESSPKVAVVDSRICRVL
ncbi:hypothetical protein GIB67_033994 [Kingdonia uniflora]|uniref:Uncharacterized protein n=1 Tax=Kingdonia uniflora TaxID=39325 RepID=A0A7J7M603_9MAGN|nr:hypothetical protein GIB67_033994 [Kingdonia uniflora]